MRKIKMMLPVALLLMVTTLLSSCKEVMGWLDNPVSACLSVKVESATLIPGATVDLGATTISTSPIKYATSDKDIATVDENGTVTAVAGGNAIITVSVAANEDFAAATKQVAITVEGDEGIPMTLEAVEDGTITIYNPNKLTILYSKNGAAKESFSDTEYIDVKAGDKVEFYGNNEGYAVLVNKKWTGTRFIPSNKVYLYGNIMSLVSENDFKNCTTITKERAFSDMFYSDDAATIMNHPTMKIVLPATTLTSACYYEMFRDCTSLTTAPALPATKLANDCYMYMFTNCTSLTTAPALPATELTDGCYQYMFQNCDALTTAPALPAMEIKSRSYRFMFNDCDALTAAPELPATKLAHACYTQMFQNCKKLTTAPSELPATGLTNYCYNQMFQNCTELTTTPKIMATATAGANSALQIFENCPKINAVYVKFAYANSYSDIFYNNGKPAAGVLHTTAANKASWETYFTKKGMTSWTVVADF